jgi:hypothetical protein
MNEVRFPTRAGIFLFFTTSRLSPGFTKPPIQSVQEVNRAKREAEFSSPSNFEVKNAWNYNTRICVDGVVLNCCDIFTTSVS